MRRLKEAKLSVLVGLCVDREGRVGKKRSRTKLADRPVLSVLEFRKDRMKPARNRLAWFTMNLG